MSAAPQALARLRERIFVMENPIHDLEDSIEAALCIAESEGDMADKKTAAMYLAFRLRLHAKEIFEHWEKLRESAQMLPNTETTP